MYNNSFTQQPFRLEMKDSAKSNGKTCDYYLKIIFFFSSLIQSLIIISLVLFLIYGKPKHSADEKRVQDLEQSFTNISQENLILIEQNKVLNETLEKKIIEKNLCDKRCERCLIPNTNKCPPQVSSASVSHMRNLEARVQQLDSVMKLLEANCTQTVQELKGRMDDVTKARDRLQLDKSRTESELGTYVKMCKDEFAKPLTGIQEVTKAFLSRIESSFPHTTFHLTCPKQQQQIDQIRANCTTLSKEVEDRFQRYLNDVGQKVAEIQNERNKLSMANSRLTEEIKQCRPKRV